MREIEIKCRITNRDELLDLLISKNIVLSEPLRQHDVVYGFPGAEDSAEKSVWLRVRTENDEKHILTLKKSVVGHLDSIEHETEVMNAEETFKIFEQLGYEPYSDLTKVRQKANYNDIEICLDEVPGLGVFVEAEKLMTAEADHDQVVAELWEFLDSLGLNRIDEVHEGYDVLERKLRGL